MAEVAPELVVEDADGKPYSVRYHVLPALLLNELQVQHRINEAQAAVIDERGQTIAALEARLARVEQELAPAE